MLYQMKRMHDMKPNPGGQLAIENIVGREDLIADMWGTLEGRSIYMNDLRRVGKTMILRKMEANQPSGWLAVKRDLGGCHTAAEFATQAYRDCDQVLTRRQRALRRMSELLGAVKGRKGKEGNDPALSLRTYLKQRRERRGVKAECRGETCYFLYTPSESALTVKPAKSGICR